MGLRVNLQVGGHVKCSGIENSRMLRMLEETLESPSCKGDR